MQVNALISLTLMLGLAGCQAGMSTTTSEPRADAAKDAKSETAAPPETPLTALGQEPGWILKLTSSALDLSYQYGTEQFKAPAPKPQQTSKGYQYTATDSEGEQLVLYVRDEYCTDTMAGLPYPYAATVSIGGQTLQGCAGDPESLLTGHQWLINDINGEGVIENSRMTLQFSGDGRVYGSAGCNRYSGHYEITGEGININQMALTRMACEPALMAQESELMAVITDARAFGLDENGSLFLRASSQKHVKASHLE